MDACCLGVRGQGYSLHGGVTHSSQPARHQTHPQYPTDLADAGQQSTAEELARGKKCSASGLWGVYVVIHHLDRICILYTKIVNLGCDQKASLGVRCPLLLLAVGGGLSPSNVVHGRSFRSPCAVLLRFSSQLSS